MCIKAIVNFDSPLKTVDSYRDIVLAGTSIVRWKGWIVQLDYNFVSSRLQEGGEGGEEEGKGGEGGEEEGRKGRRGGRGRGGEEERKGGEEEGKRRYGVVVRESGRKQEGRGDIS